MKLLINLIIVFALVLTAYLLSGGNPLVLLQINLFIMVVIPSFILAFALSPKKSFGSFIRALYKNDGYEIGLALNYSKTLGNLSLWLSFLGIIFGLIITMSAFAEGTKAETLGYHFAAALMSLIFGITLKIICLAVEHKINNYAKR